MRSCPHKFWVTLRPARGQLSFFPLHLMAICTMIFILLVIYGNALIWTCLILYVCVIYTSRSASRGGYAFAENIGLRALIQRGFKLHNKWMAKYFPGKITKTVDLDEGPYFFACHPHGIIGVGTFLNFATDTFGFREAFPKVRIVQLGLDKLFKVPFFREVLLSVGVGTCGKKSIVNFLTQGKSVAVNIGGAREALLRPNEAEVPLILKDRVGFVRLAVQTKTPIVPVYTFGEHDLYRYVDLPLWAQRVQHKLQKICGFAMPIFVGTCGLLPLPRSLEIVIGAPIRTDNCAETSEEAVARKHAEYVQALEALFEKHKEGFYSKDAKLKIVP